MRIRKLAKIHGFTFCNNNELSKTDSMSPPVSPSQPPFLQSHICQLNQSPWDVATFSPDSPSSPFQVDGDESYAASFADSTGAVESEVASMNICVGEMNNNNSSKETKLRRPRNGSRRHETDSISPAAEISTAGRRRIPTRKQVTTNPYDFYYYSGFGPRWGKRRGSRIEDEKSIGIMETNQVKHDVTAAAEEEGIDIEQFDDDIEDDDDDYNEDERELAGMTTKKKRGRKPIKARSLKSLM